MITVDVKAHGLEEIAATLKMLREEFGSRIGGVALYAVPRKEGGTPNDEIAEKLAGTKPTHKNVYKHRDFFGIRKPLPQEDQQRIANAFMSKFNVTFKLAPRTGLESTGVAAMDRKEAQNVAGNCLREAMQTYMAIVSKNIQDQTTVDGVLDPLTEAYAEYKEKTYGFVSPIGVATGQLLENLNPYAAAQNIKLTGNGSKGDMADALSLASKLLR